MKFNVSTRFKPSYKQLPFMIKRDFDKKIAIFMQNTRDSKLQTHKLKGRLQECFAFSLRNGYRVLFEYGDEGINLLDVGPHDKYYQWQK